MQGRHRAYVGIVPDEVLARQSVGRHVAYFSSDEALCLPMRTLVADVAGRVVGYAHGGPVRPEPDEELDGGELWGMYVDPGNGGHSWALIGAICDSLRVSGYREAWLWVMRDNVHARRFYEAAGWTLDPAVTRTKPLPQVRYRSAL